MATRGGLTSEKGRSRSGSRRVDLPLTQDTERVIVHDTEECKTVASVYSLSLRAQSSRRVSTSPKLVIAESRAAGAADTAARVNAQVAIPDVTSIEASI